MKTKICPLCSTEINKLNECSVCCPAYRNPAEREKHLKFLNRLNNKIEEMK